MQVSADLDHMVEKFVFFHDADGLHTRPHGKRVTAERGAVVARLKDVRRFRARHDRANGHA